MGFLDKLLGREPAGPQATSQGQPSQRQPYRPQDGDGSAAGGPQSTDERAIGRYRYLLRTAPPEAIEKVHAEAFAQLTPEQRSQVLGQLSQDLPEAERPRSDDPQEMARAATRAEMRQPGYLQQSFGRGQMGGGRMGGGMGMGGMIGGSMLGGIAGVVVGSAIASSLFGGYDQSPEAAEAGGASDGSSGDAGGDGSGDASGAGNGGQDAGYADAGGSDPGAGFDSGGGSDFGGGFGGGDFGGGDF